MEADPSRAQSAKNCCDGRKSAENTTHVWRKPSGCSLISGTQLPYTVALVYVIKKPVLMPFSHAKLSGKLVKLLIAHVHDLAQVGVALLQHSLGIAILLAGVSRSGTAASNGSVARR